MYNEQGRGRERGGAGVGAYFPLLMVTCSCGGGHDGVYIVNNNDCGAD